MTTQAVRSPLKYIGGKAASASRIIAAFPPPSWYDTYHEPCGGAAHVLLTKPNWGQSEIYNDLNDDLYNFWRQMQDHAEEMAQRLKLLPYSRKLYYDYYQRLFDGSVIEPLERAVMWFYVLRSTSTGWLRASPMGWNNSTSNAHSYRAALDLFAHVQQRLTHPRVLLENRDIAYVLKEYDSPKTLHYVDPPYKGAEYYYQAGIRKYGKKSFDHEQLAGLLNQMQGYVALSYYPYPELDAWYPAAKWRRLTWQQHKPSALAAGISEEMPEATEMLLCNYPEPVTAYSLWDTPQEEMQA
jgi:DNA adenine methylase